MIRNILLFSILSAISVLGYADENLEQEDIRPTVNKLLELHVDEHALSPKILQRSFNMYIERFDPQKIYLLKAEVQKISNPSSKFLKEALEDFKDEDYGNYEVMNNLFRNAIERSRSLRKEVYENFNTILEQVDDSSFSPTKQDGYAASREALKERVSSSFALYTYTQVIINKTPIDEKKDKVVALYERRLRSVEDDFLADQGLEGFSNKESYLEHHTTLNILKSFAKSLDSHTSYFSPQEAYNMKMQLEKGFQGIGVVLQEGLEGVLIRKIVPNGPAADSKAIESGDFIISVDGTNIENTAFDRVLELIRGKGGSGVNLTIRRFGKESENPSKNEFDVQLQRRMIVMDDSRVDVYQEPYGDGLVGVLTLHSFYEGKNGISSEKDLRNAISKLKSQGKIKGLVLDLRNNSGGFLSQAVKVAGLFMSNGVVAISKYGNGSTRYFRDLDGYSVYDGPLVVLTSKASASAAEIVSQALQDYGRAVVVGDSRTYGKGSIQHQTVTRADAGMFYKVTVGRYYTASGKSTQIKGVLADIIVPSNYHNEKVGEEFLKYPLEKDSISPAFKDPLSDINQEFKEWFEKYYIPTLQKKTNFWELTLPKLQENSKQRIKKVKEFNEIMAGGDSMIRVLSAREDEGLNDIQVNEAISIVKDMAVMYFSAIAMQKNISKSTPQPSTP